MISFERSLRRLRRPRSGLRFATCLLSAALLLAAAPQNLLAQAPPAQAAPSTPTYTPQSPEQLQQLVAPIALYPDSLVASILPAATFPEQIVEADRWVHGHPGLTGEPLAQAVNQQPWDASIKALTAFPAVLGNMDQNLSWTSSLGDAYYNQPQDVMTAVQALRQRAQAAGTLKSTPQQDVTTENSDIEIEPAQPEVVYVPEYDPWIVYGYPIVAWPGWYDYPGIWFAGPYCSFGIGFPIGFFAGFGWGWSHWGFDWHSRFVRFNNVRYASHSVTFFNRGNFYRSVGSPGFRAGVASHLGAEPHPFGDDARGGGARGFVAPRDQIGMRSGAFSGFDRGGETRGFEARGRSSFGGGDFHGGGGARGGGGAHGGGGGRGRGG